MQPEAQGADFKSSPICGVYLAPEQSFACLLLLIEFLQGWHYLLIIFVSQVCSRTGHVYLTERINEGESMLSEDKLLPATPGVRTFGLLQGHGTGSSELQTFFFLISI